MRLKCWISLISQYCGSKRSFVDLPSPLRLPRTWFSQDFVVFAGEMKRQYCETEVIKSQGRQIPASRLMLTLGTDSVEGRDQTKLQTNGKDSYFPSESLTSQPLHIKLSYNYGR